MFTIQGHGENTYISRIATHGYGFVTICDLKAGAPGKRAFEASIHSWLHIKGNIWLDECECGFYIQPLSDMHMLGANITVVGAVTTMFICGGFLYGENTTINNKVAYTVSPAYAWAQSGGIITLFKSVNFTGSNVTGKRYLSRGLSIIEIHGGATDTFFPGTIAGTTELGGIYSV